MAYFINKLLHILAFFLFCLIFVQKLSRSKKQIFFFSKKLGCIDLRLGVLSEKQDSYLYISLKLGRKWKHFLRCSRLYYTRESGPVEASGQGEHFVGTKALVNSFLATAIYELCTCPLTFKLILPALRIKVHWNIS